MIQVSKIRPNDIYSHCLHLLRPEIIAALTGSVTGFLKDAQCHGQITLHIRQELFSSCFFRIQDGILHNRCTSGVQGFRASGKLCRTSRQRVGTRGQCRGAFRQLGSAGIQRGCSFAELAQTAVQSSCARGCLCRTVRIGFQTGHKGIHLIQLFLQGNQAVMTGLRLLQLGCDSFICFQEFGHMLLHQRFNLFLNCRIDLCLDFIAFHLRLHSGLTCAACV